MDENLLALGLIVVGLFVVFFGFGKFGKKDGRTKTGYKDNIEPQTGKGCAGIIIGALLIGTGIAGLGLVD